MGMTIAQKILARASGKNIVEDGDFVTAKVDCAWTSGLSHLNSILLRECGYDGGMPQIHDTSKVVLIHDHNAPPANVQVANRVAKNKKLAEKYGITFYDSIGIQHQLIPEKGHIVPGIVATGQDSHSVTGGAFNAASTGIGPTEMAYVFALGELWFRVPETLMFRTNADFADFVTPKDLMIYIGTKWGSDVAQYKSMEWSGPAIDNISIDGRMHMACQSMELGAKFCIFEADKKCIDYVRARTDTPFTPVKADPDAVYEKEYELDVANLEPMVAYPHNIENGHPISEAEGIKIDQGSIGSCAHGRLEDFAAAAKVLKGKKIHPKVKMIMGPGSLEVFKMASDAGYISTLLDANVRIIGASCGVCSGFRGVIGDGEVCIASTTRNFVGRMGSANAEIYMSNPYVVAASCLKGEITDPRKVM